MHSALLFVSVWGNSPTQLIKTIPARIFKNDKSIVFKSIKYLFDKAYSCADQLIVIGRDMKEIIAAKVIRFNTVPSISVVTNWSNPEKALCPTKDASYSIQSKPQG